MIEINLLDGVTMLLPSIDRAFGGPKGYYIIPDISVPELKLDITPECFENLRRTCSNHIGIEGN